MKKSEMPRHLMTKNETTDYGRISDDPQPQDESQKELFTGGEWQPESKHVNESPASEWFTRAITDEHGQRVALIYGDTETQAEANSALIAQAKNMYYKLQELLEQFEKAVEPKYTLDKMLIIETKALLKKANPSL